MPTERDNQIPDAKNKSDNLQGAAQEKDAQIVNSKTGPTGLPKAVEEMEDQVQKTTAKSEMVRKGLVEAQAFTPDLHEKVQSLTAELTEEHDRGKRVREQASLLSKELVETEAVLRQKALRLGRIESSTGWRLVQVYHALTGRLFPFGSWRREVYRRSLGRLIKTVLGRGEASTLPEVSLDSQAASFSFGQAASAAVDEHPGPDSRPEIVIHCYSPHAGEACGRRHLIRGWASASSGIIRVEILKDGETLGDALFSTPEPEVEGAPPTFGGDCHSGFFYIWDATKLSEGSHTITIRAESKSGARHDLLIPVTLRHSTESNEYQQWIAANKPLPRRLAAMTAEAKTFRYSPLISIVTAVFDTTEKRCRELLASVRAQIYPNWELCVAVPTRGNSEVIALIETLSGEDSRIKFIKLAENFGASEGANAAISLAMGEFITFIDSDDLLSPDILYWNIRLLQDHSDADLIYYDEDKLDLTGNRCEPFFKPDWSPDLLLSVNYIGDSFVVRRQVLKDIGGLRSEYNGSQNYDFILRLVERTERILHIPRILLHKRGRPDFRFSSDEVSPQAYVTAERSIGDYLKRNRVPARVEPGCTLGRWQVRYEIRENPRVAVILPTGGRMDLLEPCLESLFSQTDYPHHEIILVDNSKGPQVEQYVKSLATRRSVLTHLDYRNKKFNFSALNNYAVGKTDAPLLLLLNDDITVVTTNWMSALVEHGQRTGVGAVGAKLIYPSGNIQHAGVVMGIYECTSHAFKHLPADTLHYFAFPQIIRNCSAVTAACMLTKRAAYLEVGGLDEKNLAVAFQDVDYCLKLCKAGYHIVYTPLAVLTHHESVTKEEKIPNMREVRFVQKKWRDVIEHDPFYNPNLTRIAEDYSLRLK
ncbi:MAG TPA: glycosyltransferase [Terriglobia bacterium]|nr:glycosyltransferase [Terriglobia bacterium]